MGDRANIFATDQRDSTENEPRPGIYLYTHWSGYGWPEHLRLALNTERARRRWNDSSYLLRIVIDSVFENLRGSETGGGVSTQLTDNEHDIIILDLVTQKVAFAEPGDETDANKWYGHLTFAEFCDQIEAKYPRESDYDEEN